MHITRSTLSAFFIASILSVSVPVDVLAGNQASVKVEQLSASSYGKWTLLAADGSAITSDDKGIDKQNYSFGVSQFGPTTFSVTPPPGMSAKITVYRGGDIIEVNTSQQYSFNLYPNDNYRLLVQYALTKLGSLGVTSEPSGVRFRMKGPTGRTLTGITPKTFKNIPVGTYAVYMGKSGECLQPPVHSIKVEEEQRNTLDITLRCDTEEDQNVDRTRPSRRSIRDYATERETNPRGERK